MNTIQRRLAGWILGNEAVKAISLSAITRDIWRGWTQFADGTDGTSDYTHTPTGYVQAVRSNVWAANCMRVRASVVAQTPMKLYRYDNDGDRVEVEDHPAIDLLDSVNPVRDTAASFRRAIEEQLTIHGTAYALKVRGAGKQPSELYWLPAHLVEPIADDAKFIAGYRWLVDGRIYPAEDVIRWWYPSPDGSINALSPTSTALRYINAYNAADIAAEAIDKRGGQGGGIVSYDAMMLPVDFARMSEQWDRKRKNPENAGMDLHMPPGTDYKSGALTAQQMQREERMMRLAKNIMSAYRIPPAAAGDMSDASVLANAAAQMRSLWEIFALDELNFIAEGFNHGLLWREWPETREELWFEHDTSEVAALQEDATARAERAVLLLQGEVVSLNEAREIISLERVEVEEADNVNMTKREDTKREDTRQDKPEDAPPDDEEDAQKATPDQPRVPAGSPNGGQWTSGGGGIASAMESVERATSERGIERLVVLSDGVPIYTLEGTEDKVILSETVKNELKQSGGKVSTVHNHPTGSAPSALDIGLFAAVGGEHYIATPHRIFKIAFDKPLPENQAQALAKDWGDTLKIIGNVKLQKWEKAAEFDPILKKRGKLQTWEDIGADLLQKFANKNQFVVDIQQKTQATKAADEPFLMPLVDFVGMTATDAAGVELGVIEKIHRKPNAAQVIIAGKAYPAEDVRVRIGEGVSNG